ncbi:hypothetical protein FisN_9Lh274 [Fistulifera solaris]|uniref:Cyclic nucleotide-binding domain-containing protein n=1 Tax=Fistulifera solaris TaxID=1519565 RepID=A0A1Z5KKX4_FISSO|nr:hypothetical protein FisN_9Lh274 [Fistulifera solaris]|eukprot:GAX26970.1 hypothetical protein FisN_9Lh274 [Fistulifera solaris]
MRRLVFLLSLVLATSTSIAWIEKIRQHDMHSPFSKWTASVLNSTRAGDPSAAGFPKSKEEYTFLETALLNNVLFTNLPNSSLVSLIDAFECVTVPQHHVLVQQGEHASTAAFVFVLASGLCTVTVDGNVVPEPYGTLTPGSIVGELGVLFNTTRAATITAKTETVTLYRVDADTFKRVLNRVIPPADQSDLFATIDEAIKQVAGTKTLYGGDIIRQYVPSRYWLWTRWAGTILQYNIKTTLFNMLFSFGFILLARRITNDQPPFHMGLSPNKTHPFIERLTIVHKLWSYQMSLTTFILTFFLNQSFGFWQEIYSIARRIQGRLNDFHVLLATHATREEDYSYTPAAEKMMDDIGAYSRLFHILFWASLSRRFQVLRTPRGLERLASRGLMTSQQLKILNNLDLPENQKHNACLEWMMTRALKGMKDGGLRDDMALQWHLIDQLCVLRATYAGINDKLTCRMPLAYTHFVQILVDTFCLLSPLALYADLGAYSIFCVGILTLFYTGLLDLAKIFLDPLNNEKFTKNSIYMDIGVLIRESNAGSVRWKNAGAQLPF